MIFKLTRRKKKAQVDSHIVTYHKPQSLITEEYRNLCVNIITMEEENPDKAFIITSSQENEGKGVVLCNLGVCMARELKKKILLVDVDFEKPGLHKLLHFDMKHGLLDYIQNGNSVNDIVKETSVENMFIVTVGGIPTESMGILTSNKMKQFVDEARKEFDFVLFTTAPVNTHADAAILGPMTDGVILVIVNKKTQRETVERAQMILKNAHTRTLGCILSDIRNYIPEVIDQFLR
ncbi:CpsD/CapB family tyrosine-protein kinase [Chlamydiota bacterium]